MTRLSRGASVALLIATAVATPFVVVGIAVVITFQSWIIDAAYTFPGFGDDPALGVPGEDPLSVEERKSLAEESLHSVAPLGTGADSLTGLRLPDGSTAFGPDEVSHMRDVENVVRAVAVAGLFGVFVIAVALIRLRSVGAIDAGLGALGIGSLLTLAAAASFGVWISVDFDGAFRAFHEVTFDPGTWTFSSTETLIRIYPETFWTLASSAIAALIIALAGGIALTFAGPVRRFSSAVRSLLR